MTTDTPPLTVCIVTHRRPAMLRKLLTTICADDLPAGFREIVVVENGGCPESRDVVDEFSDRCRIRHLESSSGAKCAALNVAIREIDEGLIAFIDDDVVPCPGWVSAYARAYADHGSGYYFGGPNDPAYDDPPPEWLKRYLPASAAGLRLPTDGPQSERLYFLGFNWAAEADALRECGGFSVRFGPGTELGVGDESFMMLQLANRGIQPVYVSGALVHHYVPPERCSTDWCLGREAGGSFCAGMQYELYQRTHERPVRAWGRAIKRAVQRTTWRDLSRAAVWSAEGRHWVRNLIVQIPEFVRGVRYGAAHHSLDPDRWTADGLGEAQPRKLVTSKQ